MCVYKLPSMYWNGKGAVVLTVTQVKEISTFFVYGHVLSGWVGKAA